MTVPYKETETASTIDPYDVYMGEMGGATLQRISSDSTHSTLMPLATVGLFPHNQAAVFRQTSEPCSSFVPVAHPVYGMLPQLAAVQQQQQAVYGSATAAVHSLYAPAPLLSASESNASAAVVAAPVAPLPYLLAPPLPLNGLIADTIALKPESERAHEPAACFHAASCILHQPRLEPAHCARVSVGLDVGRSAVRGGAGREAEADCRCGIGCGCACGRRSSRRHCGQSDNHAEAAEEQSLRDGHEHDHRVLDGRRARRSARSVEAPAARAALAAARLSHRQLLLRRRRSDARRRRRARRCTFTCASRRARLI